MLGQEDNPSRLREEIERARLQSNESKSGVSGGTAVGSPAVAASGDPKAVAATSQAAKPIDLVAAEQALFDPP